ncbi:MAG: glycosyl hydrolase family 18 protein [Bacteroidota bacterium]
MKSNQSLLTGILVFYLCMVTGIAGAREKNDHVDITTHFSRSLSISSLNRGYDTVPKDSKAGKAIQQAAKDALPKIEVPKIQPPKASSNLFKKIADAFKFRKNAREKEQKRVVDIFESLGVNDSIAASAENIKTLIDELSIRENQHYDSLIAIINEIKARKPEPAKVIATNPKPDVPVAEPSDSKVVTDKDIEDLTNKMLPLIAEKANETKSTKDKRTTLAALRKIRNGSAELYFVTDTAKGIVKRFTLNVRNKAEVYGIYNYNTTGRYDDLKFSFLNTLIYNSLFVNSKTGNIKDLNGWDTAGIISYAQKSGCAVVYTASIQQPFNTEGFLMNNKAQKAFVDNAIFLLRMRKAKGVNIQFAGIHNGNKPAFTRFIKFLSEVLKIQDTSYRVLITIPAFENTDGYDWKALNEYTDRFLVNFSAIRPSLYGATAPLKGKRYSMETLLSRFLNENVPAEKIIAGVSYTGTKWAVTPFMTGGRFIQPLTYSEIRRRYDWPVYYDDESASAVMDSLNAKQDAIRTIFFDDAVSLEKKYDYILENGLGGVTIDALGYDKGYGDLWDALSYKFAVIDTLYLKDSIIGKVNTDLSFLEKASRYLTLFRYVLNNPCEICFENIPDPEYAAEISRYLQELQIDSLIIAENKTLPLKDKIRSKFEYVNSKLSTCLGYLTLFMLLLTMVCGGIYLYKIKSESEQWPWKKKAEIILIGLCILLVVTTFTYLFTNDTIPIFGATPKKQNSTTIGFSKDLSKAMAIDADTSGINTVVVISDTDANYCTKDPNDTCINMPFPTLMAIILVGILIGVLITRYLIMPLLERNDIP